MHTVSKEIMRKDTRDRKDMRGTKCTYYNTCFLILLLVKSRLGTFPPVFVYNLFTLFINIKKKDLNLYKIVSLVEKFYCF